MVNSVTSFRIVPLACFIASLICIGSTAKMDVKCGACLALVDEMDHVISRIDPKKKIQVGSFRIDPQGNQKLKEVPYARSEVYLTEQFEEVCAKMSKYAESDQGDKGKLYIRTESLDGGPVSLTKASISKDVQVKLQSACQAIVEEYEEEMIAVFKKIPSDVQKEICVNELEICPESAPESRLWAQAEAVMAGMKEKEKADQDRLEKALREEEERKKIEEEEDEEDGDDDEADVSGDEEDEEDEEEDVAEPLTEEMLKEDFVIPEATIKADPVREEL